MQSFAIQQIFESLNIRVKLQNCRHHIVTKIQVKVKNIFRDNEPCWYKVADLEETYGALDTLGQIQLFEEMINEELIQLLAKQIVGKTGLEETIQALTKLFTEELDWIIQIQNISSDHSMWQTVSSVLSGILLKGIFNKTEYFPVAQLDIFASNYQQYFSFAKSIFKSELPVKL